MTERPKLLDLFCGAGGAAKGYQRAGFEVFGVDIAPQANYCGDHFIEADALEVLRRLLRGWMWAANDLWDFDAVHASPPCQANSPLRHLWKDREHPELIPPTRELLVESGLPYVIENVPGAALIEPIVLCGSMFGNGANGRQLRRHRLFEANFGDAFLFRTPMCQHHGQALGVYGYGGGGAMTRGYKGSAAEYREAMEMPWATKAEIAQAIPPSYTEFVGSRLLEVLETRCSR